MKSRASFTIEANVLSKLDSVVDNITYKSKSEAVEDILRKFFDRQHTAVILCGGNFLINDTDIYRPLAKIGNYTIIENTITALRLNGFTNIFVSGQTELLKNVFRLLRNGEGFGVDIKYVDDNTLNGSAKALERMKQYVGSTTLFVTGDAVLDLDLKDMLRFHAAHNSVASMAISTSAESAGEISDKIVIKGNRVSSYERLNIPIKSKLVPTSLFVFDKEIFKYIPPGDMEWDIKKDLLPLLAKDGLLYAYLYSGNWLNVKTKSDIESAKAFLEKVDKK
jgi:NDP-sugar pyrophosphorylase family protein